MDHEEKLVTETNASVFWRGLKRMVLALFTAVSLGLAVYTLIAVTWVTGYWAVLLFFASVLLLFWTTALIYAQGANHNESQGDNK